MITMKVNVLYSHRADPATPLEEQIQAFNEQISKGHCNAVSNSTSNQPASSPRRRN